LIAASIDWYWLGVARISHGHGPWARAMQDLSIAAKLAMAALD
jgi:hypothetical protein